MRLRHAMVCAMVLLNVGSAWAGDDETLHPTLGTKPPREVLNRDILNLTQEEGSAWVHGAVAQMAHILVRHNPERSRCIMAWFFEGGDGAEQVPYIMKQIPDTTATSTVIAITEKACPLEN